MGSDAYRRAGVDTAAAQAFVERIKPHAAAAGRAGVMGGLGGFGGLFDLKAAGWRDPILVAATDGVGTKLKLAIETGAHDRIGQDLVAMCVNDLAAQGAEPLFFLDYFATGALDATVGEAVVAGIARACRACGCALLGGETAEMPGLYRAGDYDLAGFAVGAVERERLLPRPDVAAGDRVIGVGSSGPHANGYSLIRRIVADAGLAWSDPAPFAPETSLGSALLTPTRLYPRAARAAAEAGAGAIAHVTGGGFPENLPRALPETLAIRLDYGAWRPPAVFGWLKRAGDLSDDDMTQTFNCGVGLAVIAAPAAAEAVTRSLRAAGETAFAIGEVILRDDAALVGVGALDWA